METRGRKPLLGEYGWGHAEGELAIGVHPEVVAARLGEPIARLLEVADKRRWMITWQRPTAEQILTANERQSIDAVERIDL